MEESLWVEPVGKIVIARVRGETTDELLQRCQARVLALLSDSASRCALYDLLEAHAPSADVALSQVNRDERGIIAGLRRAVVVPNSRLAYMARIAFGSSDHRVFYSDLAAAIRWLEQDDSPCAPDYDPNEALNHAPRNVQH